MRLLMIRATLALLIPVSCAFFTLGQVHAGQTSSNALAGKFFGKEFKPDAVVLENRQLTIRQGDSFNPAMVLYISIFDIGRGDIPEGKTFTIGPESRETYNLMVSAQWQGEGGNQKDEMIRDGYRLKLSFGKETIKGLLPGTIEFSLPGSPVTTLSGSFVAGIKGVRIINGKVDLTSDASETLDEVALEYLKKKHPGLDVKIAEKRDGRLVSNGTLKKWGYKDLAVTVGGKPAGRVKLLFTKQSGEWAVFSELAPHQFPDAHPVYPPDENDYSELVISAAAQKGESDFLTSYPGKGVHGVFVDCIYDDSVEGFSGASLKYTVDGSDEERQRVFILYRKIGRWEVLRELDSQANIGKEIAREKMNLDFPKPCDTCRVTGVLTHDGKAITTVTSVRPTFWFRSEQKNIEVLPKVGYENGRVTFSGLPPGDYGMSVNIDANPANPVTYPGDYQTFIRFTVTDGESTLPEVDLKKVLHLTAPQDNGSLMEHYGEERSGSLSFPSPVGFTWEPLGEGISYDYQITRVDCKSYQTLATVAKGTTREASISVQLPKSAPEEFYMFMLYALKKDAFVGLLTTHGHNGYGWDYRFRVR